MFGHRGAAGIAPENTLESFRLALEQGARYLELDVHATRDREVVVLHDSTIDRTTDGRGAVRDMTLAEVRQLDAGARFPGGGWRGRQVRVPTLGEIAATFPGVPLNVEIKQVEPAIEGLVVRTLRSHGGLGRVVLAAEHHVVMERIRAEAGDAHTSLSFEEAREFFERFFASDLEGYEPVGRALQIPPRFEDVVLVTEESVEAAHSCGLEMHVWTINDPEEIRRLLELGIDGIMSDFPERLAEAVAR